MGEYAKHLWRDYGLVWPTLVVALIVAVCLADALC